MILLTIAAWWIVFSIPSYLWLRRLWINDFKKWTKGDRARMLALSIFAGPVGLIVAAIIHGSQLSEKRSNDDLANW